MPAVVCHPGRPRAYRYWLEVRLAPGGPRLAVILKNPSTATAEQTDPTLNRLTAWARRRGLGTVALVNLFTFRATQPAALNAVSYWQAVGPQADNFLHQAARWADILIAAWGQANGIERGRYDRRIAEVRALLAGRPLHRVGSLTAQGYPRHSLWWTDALTLVPFDNSAPPDKLPLLETASTHLTLP
jgi:hypothetical protein